MTEEHIQWGQHFPLYQSEEYDLSFPNLPFPIGIKSTMPDDLIRRISAAAISFLAGNRGIDYTYKRYTQNNSYRTNDGSRIDIRISRAINNSGNQLSSLLHHITTTGDKIIGNIICEWTIMRIPHAINQLMSLAHRGNLYECCAVARMILEQLAWAAAIDELVDKESIDRTRAEGSIPALKRTIRFAGSLYGWLSSHSHWRYDGHIKSMEFTQDGMATVLRSPRFKAISVTVALLLMASSIHTLRMLRATDITSLLALPAETRIAHGKTLGMSRSKLEMAFGEPTGPAIKEIQSLLALSSLLNLINEVRATGDGDADITLLWEMAEELRNAVGAS
jgi:hypothetical protein